MTATPSSPTPQQVLQRYFGYESFRPHQERLIAALMAGRDVLGVMPTGAGKSLLYQVPALAMDGMALVVSPLISLMKDQVDALRQAGAAAALLNSTLLPDEADDVYRQARAGWVKLLYVTPERLASARFLTLCQQAPISLIAVDEAHCVSQWGNDFRPDYGAIAAFIGQLPARPPVCATTATATSEVRDDIIASLRLRDPEVCVAGFDRQNLYLGVLRPVPADKPTVLLAELRKRQGRPGIVYCSTRRSVEEVYDLLQSQGLAVARYHGGMGDEERRRSQDDFIFDRRPLMVATNAFGMGIDKPDIGFVLHYNMPSSLEGYYQEAGRAGRDGSPADCLLLYSAKDVRTVDYLAQKSHERRLAEGMAPALSEALYHRDQERIRRMAAYCKTTDCLRSAILRYFGEADAPYRCEHCSSCAAASRMLDAGAERALAVLACAVSLADRERALGRQKVIDILRGSTARELLQSRLDTLPGYGALRQSPKPLLHAVLDALVEAGCLSVAPGQYPVLNMTSQGEALLRSNEPFMLKVAEAKAVAGPGDEDGQPEAERAPGGGRLRLAGAGVDAGLLSRLKALRWEIAQRQGLPAYIIFHDKTLLDMCARRPRSMDELLQVTGVGQRKAELYGEEFLGCIRGYGE